MSAIFYSRGDKDDFTTLAGTVTDVADAAFGSGQKMRLSVGSPAVTVSATRNSVLADAGRRLTFEVVFSALPSASRSFFVINDTSGNAVFVLQLSSGGALINAPVGATAVVGSMLATGTKYRISVGYTVTNTTTFEFRVRVNGVLDSTANAGTLTRTGSDRLQFIHNTNWPVNGTYDYSNIYVDDGTDRGDVTPPATRSLYYARRRRAA